MIAIVNTERDWFDYMRSAGRAGVANFWTPTTWNVRGLGSGDRVYLRLKGSGGFVGGWGTFVRYRNDSVASVWHAFGPANGAPSLAAMLDRLRRIARNPELGAEHIIGCIVLESLVLLPPDAFRTTASLGVSYPPTVQKFKYFELDVLPFGEEVPVHRAPFELVPVSERATKQSEIKDRAGQERFRKEVRDAYRNSCAITGETQAETLDAAHIQPHVGPASNHVQNGILLRVDLHRLFDAGLITFDERLRVQVSSLVTSRAYRALAGTRVRLPASVEGKPSHEALNFHRTDVFRP